MSKDNFEEEKTKLTPENGFNLVGIDYLSDSRGQLYLIEHFETYQEALKAKKNRDNSEEFFVLYKDSSGNHLSR